MLSFPLLSGSHFLAAVLPESVLCSLIIYHRED